jgi:uncharacterized protein (TIGR02145 family)
MARNLNYQTGLTFQKYADSPSTATGSNTALIGHFWCPGGYSSPAAISTRASCDVWGALYSWETAMSFDGKGTWTESPSTYNTGAANSAAAKVNHGRTANGSGRGGRGICPPNWHVPTDNEWGIILDGMESDGGTAHQDASGSGFFGTYAGKYGKSACALSGSLGAGVDDTHAYWYYNNEDTKGTDAYGFRVLPSGLRYNDGSIFANRGNTTFFWSSSAYDGWYAWLRYFYYNDARVYRYYGYNRSYGLSVRCIKN